MEARGGQCSDGEMERGLVIANLSDRVECRVGFPFLAGAEVLARVSLHP